MHCISRSKEGQRRAPPPPPRGQFISFSGSFREHLAIIIGWCAHLWGWRTSSGKFCIQLLHWFFIENRFKLPTFPVIVPRIKNKYFNSKSRTNPQCSSLMRMSCSWQEFLNGFQCIWQVKLFSFKFNQIQTNMESILIISYMKCFFDISKPFLINYNNTLLNWRKT